jgi:nucleotide-binding universal stress UspA family protein
LNPRRCFVVTNILAAFSESVASRAMMEFLATMPLDREKCQVTLLHIFMKPSASEELMGKKYTAEQPARLMAALQKAKDKLVEKGFSPDHVQIDLVAEPYVTVADGIIDQCKRRGCQMVMIGRKKMSKAEEFVMGDVCVKLVRALEGVAVLVVKSK